MTAFFKWRISTEFNRKTEKKYWVNGHQVRGKDHHSFAASLRNRAILFTFSWSAKYVSLSTFKLI